jgi:energy-coupling factor transport system permease protein
MIPLLVPLFVSAFRRADELALAMEARCYRGGENRTRLRVLKYSAIDAWAGVSMAALLLLVVVI